jgi:tetratricopeptide (TPR) repeat protein
LRNLFIVHASLAEFDLAFKAYESYVEIVTRGKDRVEKSGEALEGIDSDSTVLRTSAEAIRLLCRFGSRHEAEKALEIGHSIERWLEQSEHIRSASDAGSVASADTIVEPGALAAAFCAIGVSQAHWARYTYEVEQRAVFQTKAIQCLRKSLSPGLSDSNNIEALYALALVLAETRDIPGAIKVVKRALSPASKPSTTVSTDGVLSSGIATEYGRERKLIPMWHLLALLLTSREDYIAAEKACEAAFEQFGDPTTLFGDEENNAYRSEHLNESTGQVALSQGIVDRMEGFEKSGILQIKMTQLALLETTEDSITAVDGCDELLALYSRLFGDPTGQKLKLDSSTRAMPPPKSAVGTVRGSIFRGRGTVKTTQKDLPTRDSSVLSSKGSTAATQSGPAPAIQVTEEDGTTHGNGHHRHHLFHRHKHEKSDESQPGVQRSPSKKLQKRSSASLRRESISEPNHAPEVPPLPENVANGAAAQEKLSPQKSTESREQPLRPVAHNMNHTSPPLDHDGQPPKQDMRLPAPFPNADYVPSDPRFDKVQERRQKVSLLVEIWLFISGLYSRARMYQDAREAVAEAMKLVEAFEAEVSQVSSTAKSLSEKGWGGGKSVEELWADTFAAVSTLYMQDECMLTDLQRGELLVAQTWHHQARSDFERALLHFPDHPAGIVGLSNILLDIYSETIPLEPTPIDEFSIITPSTSVPSTLKDDSNTKTQHLTSHIPSAENQLSPPLLNRLAARDRAYGLLSTLTKLGSGWDYSEAWYALARAYEESGQIEKTKEVLWWCVELEDTHPTRSWKSVGMGGFVL